MIDGTYKTLMLKCFEQWYDKRETSGLEWYQFPTFHEYILREYGIRYLIEPKYHIEIADQEKHLMFLLTFSGNEE